MRSNIEGDSFDNVRSSVLIAVGLGVMVASVFVVAGSAVDQKPTAPVPPHLARLPRNVLSTANLTHNALVLNGTPLQNLAVGALTGTALLNEPAVGPYLFDDPYTAKFMEYLIQCALPETATVTASDGVNTLDFNGALGLAPEWADGPCLEACQEWVSACMLARTNVFGVTVQLYFDGPNPALQTTGNDYGNYDVVEGAFYGNIFLEPPRQYSCRGPGNEPLYQSFRVCARPGHLCQIQNIGPCGEIDGETGLPAKRHACSEVDANGNYLSCRNRMTTEGTNEFPEPNIEYRRIMTTRLLRTTFSDGNRAGECSSPPDGGVADSGITPPSGSSAGSRCLTDEDCNSSVLLCDVRAPNYSCTGACNNSARIDYEEADCDGAGSTCLELGAGFRFCTQACTPGRAPGEEGACQAGRVCYNGWLHRSTPDRPGCYTYCSQDSDCNGGATCNPRVGACGDREDLSLLPDGSPCPLDQLSCRGLCFSLVTTSTLGVCGSIINGTIDEECPDDPEVIKPFFGGMDDFGVCAFRNCRSDGDCMAPLRCLNGPMGTPVCTMYE